MRYRKPARFVTAPLALPSGALRPTLPQRWATRGSSPVPARLEFVLRDPQGAGEDGSQSAICRLALGQARGDLREVLEPRRAVGQIPLKPPQSRPLVLRRTTLRSVWQRRCSSITRL